VNWYYLSSNPNAIPILEQHLDKLIWYKIYTNPNAIHLFTKLNLQQMRENCRPFAEELAAYVFHPSRLIRICDAYGLDLEDYFELV